MSFEKWQAVPVVPGERYGAYMPHSEVCMHMKVAGRYMQFVLTGGLHPSVQLFHPSSGQLFSAPITPGEAGLYRQGETNGGFAGPVFYFYPEANKPELSHAT